MPFIRYFLRRLSIIALCVQDIPEAVFAFFDTISWENGGNSRTEKQFSEIFNDGIIVSIGWTHCRSSKYRISQDIHEKHSHFLWPGDDISRDGIKDGKIEARV
jgi:hypothetical protein